MAENSPTTAAERVELNAARQVCLDTYRRAMREPLADCRVRTELRDDLHVAILTNVPVWTVGEVSHVEVLIGFGDCELAAVRDGRAAVHAVLSVIRDPDHRPAGA